MRENGCTAAALARLATAIQGTQGEPKGNKVSQSSIINCFDKVRVQWDSSYKTSLHITNRDYYYYFFFFLGLRLLLETLLNLKAVRGACYVEY